MTIRVEWENDGQRTERYDHEGTSAPLEEAPSVRACLACGKTWQPRFGCPTRRLSR